MRELIITERSNLIAVADAVRNRTGETGDITLREMVGDIGVIASEPELQSKTVTPSTSVQSITADSGFDGLDTVTVNAIPSQYIIPSGTKTITENGTHDVANYASATVNVSKGIELPTLTNEGSASDLLSGKQLIDGEGNVVTGTIATKTSSNLTASGATVTVPAGYYATQAAKSVSTASQATPSVSINSSGLITASATQSEGYVTAGTKSGTKQLTTQAAKTVTPTKSSQTVVASGVYTTGEVIVGAIPSEYIDTSDATASADEIMSGETAYVNGSKVTGTFTIDSELSTQDDLIFQIQSVVDNLPEAGGEPVLQTKTVTPTTSSQNVVADSGYDGLIKVTVNAIPDSYVQPSGTLSVTANGTHDVTNYASVNVNVASSGGSGGSVETCTVILNFDSDATANEISYSHLDENGKVTTSYTDYGNGQTNFTLRLENVVCGSLLLVTWRGASPGVSTEFAERVDGGYSRWKVSTISGSIDTMNFIGDD